MTTDPARMALPDDASPWPYEARAWLDDELVASSHSAQRIQRQGEPAMLLFPADDLIVNSAELPPDVLLDGAAAGFVAFDHDRLRVELVDAPDDDPERELSVKRFPIWGDVAELIELVDVRPVGEGRYTAALREGHGRSIVEGSQMLGQAIVAACREVPGRRVISATMTFMRVVHDSMPYAIEVETVSSGRSFSSFIAHVVQEGRRCASGMLLLGTTSPDVMRHEVDAPSVAGPSDSEPLDMSVIGRDLRVAEGAYRDDADAPIGPPVIDAWLRYRDIPDDQVIHAGLLAQFSGAMSIAASMRPHAGIGQDQAHRTLSTAPMAITISFHADVRADDWMLIRHLSTFAGDGMTHTECRVHDLAGRLIASFSVESMVKAFASKRQMDEKVAL